MKKGPDCVGLDFGPVRILTVRAAVCKHGVRPLSGHRLCVHSFVSRDSNPFVWPASRSVMPTEIFYQK